MNKIYSLLKLSFIKLSRRISTISLHLYPSLVTKENRRVENKIIFTDGISWYFLEKQQIDVPENPVILVDNSGNWNILKDKIANFINRNWGTTENLYQFIE